MPEDISKTEVVSLSDLLSQQGISPKDFKASQMDQRDNSAISLEGQKAKSVLSMTTMKKLQDSGIDTSKGVSEAISDQIRAFIGFDDAKVQELKAQGEIGAWENMARKKSSVAGDIFSFFALASPQGQDDLRHALDGTDNPNPPAEMFQSPTMMLARVLKATERLQKTTKAKVVQEYVVNPEQRDRDEGIVVDYLIGLEEERIRGTSMGGQIGAGVLQLPEFMLSFMATGGLATLTKTGAKKGLQMTLSKSVDLAAKTGIGGTLARGLATAQALGVPKVVGTGVGLTVGALTRTAALPQFTAKNFIQRRVGSNFELTNKGYVMLNESNQKPITSFYKALGDTLIEVGSEELGSAVINPALSAVMPKGWTKGLEKMFNRYHPLKSVRDLWNKAGYDGFIAELGEEQLGDLFRAVTGVEDFGTDNPDRILDRMSASLFGWEELGVNAGVLSVPGAASLSTNVVLSSIRKSRADGTIRKSSAKPTRPPTDAEVDTFIRDAQARKESEKEAKTQSLETGEAEVSDAERSILETRDTQNRQTQEDFDAQIASIDTTDIEGPQKADLEKQKSEAGLRMLESLEVGDTVTFQGQEHDVTEAEGEGKDTRVVLTGRTEGLDFEVVAPQSNIFTNVEGVIEAEVSKRVSRQPKPVEETKKTKTKKKQALSPERKLIVEGRKVELDRQANDLIDQVDVLLGKRKAAVSKKLGTKGVDAQLEKIDKKLDSIDREMGELINSPGSVKFTEGKAKIVTTPLEVLKAIETKAREGETFTKAQIKKTQKSLNTFIDKLNIESNEKNKLRRRIPNIQTPAQLSNAMPKLRAAVLISAEKTTQKRLVNSITRKLKASKPKGKKKPIKKSLTADTQKDLTVIREAVKTSAIGRDNKLRDNFGKLASGTLTAEQTADLQFENAALVQGGDIKNRSSSELAALNAAIDTLLIEGREGSKAKAAADRNRRDQMTQRAIASVIGDKPLDESTSQKDKNFQKFRDTMSAGMRSFDGWEDGWDVISQDHKGSKPFESPLNQDMRVTFIENQERNDVATLSQEYVNLGIEAFELKNQNQFFKKVREDSKTNIDLGTIEDRTGKVVKLDRVSKSQIRKIKMELLDPVLRQSLIVAEGGYQFGKGRTFQGVTEKFEQAIDEQLSDQDLKFIDETLKLYKRVYKIVNKQYRKDFGVDLPFNDFYSPIRRSTSSQSEKDTFMGQAAYMRNVNPTSIISRTANVELVQVQSDVQALMRHLIDTQHYVNWSDKLKDIGAVMANKDFKNAVIAKFGEGVWNTQQGFVTKYSNQGQQRTGSFDKHWRGLRRNFTISALALKPALAAKQMVSVAAYTETISTVEFTKGMVEFMKSPVETYNKLEETGFFGTRGSNITRDIRDSVSSADFSVLGQKPTMDKWFLMATRLGDQGAIIMGGGAFYHALRKKGMTHEKALEQFLAQTEATQQSGSLSQLSEFQSGPAFQQLFSMFMTSQIQYVRREKAALRSMLSGRITAKEAAKKVFLYHVVLPSLFQFVSNFGRWDTEEQIRAALLGPLNGVFFIGDVMDSIIRTSLNSFAGFDLKVWDQNIGSSPVFDITKGILRAIGDLSGDDLTMEDYQQAIEDLSKETIGPGTGIPVKRFFDMWEGIDDIIDGDVARGSFKLAGWSPYTVDNELDKKSKSSGKGRFKAPKSRKSRKSKSSGRF